MASCLVTFSNNVVPLFVGTILLIAKLKGVRVYEAFIQGGAAKGFELAIRMIPYLVAILAAISVARASGLLELILCPLEDPWLWWVFHLNCC